MSPLLLAAAIGLVSAPSIAQEVRFKDMNGRTVQLKAPAQRSVTTIMPGAPLFAAVNQGVKGLVGMHQATHSNLPTMLLPQIFPAMEKVRHDITRGSSFAPNVESLLEINPDIVWQWGHMGDDLLTPIEAAGLNVAALSYGSEEDTQQWITLFARSIGQPERGQQMNAWRNQVRSTLKTRLAAIPQAQRQRVMYLSRYQTGMAAAGQSGNFQTDVAIAGGRNVNDSKAAAPTINVEQLMIWDPDIIVLTNFEHGLTPETLYKNPILSQLSAVRNKRVYKVPAGGYYWDPPSQDSPLYWMWLAKLMYPQQTAQLDLRAEMRQAYQSMYGFAITEAQIDQVLHLHSNQASRNYLSTFAAGKRLASR